MKVKVNEATGAVLDYLVALCLPDDTVRVYFEETGEKLSLDDWEVPEFSPSTDWSQGGPIIEREEIAVQPVYSDGNLCAWNAAGHDLEYDEDGEYIDGSDHNSYGPTPLVAAMRCYCSAKLGDIVDVPEELCQLLNS